MQDRLTQEDLELIEESKGIFRGRSGDADLDFEDADTRKRKAAKLGELRNELFIDDDQLELGSSNNNYNSNSNYNSINRPKKDKKKQQQKRPTADTFDEEGMEDFIDDDMGNEELYRDDLDMDMGPDVGVSEAQMSEVNDIFGTEFLEGCELDFDSYGRYR